MAEECKQDGAGEAGAGASLEPGFPGAGMAGSASGRTVAVSRDGSHSMGKPNRTMIRLLEGLGVEGDAHSGKRVKHLARVKRDPEQRNLRQVHLIHAELLDELREGGIAVAPGEMGENITTWGIDLLNLPTGSLLHVGETAVIQLTGLRDPCSQLEKIQPGLMAATLDRDDSGRLIRKAGVMGIVVCGGESRPGDPIRVELPPLPHRPLESV